MAKITKTKMRMRYDQIIIGADNLIITADVKNIVSSSSGYVKGNIVLGKKKIKVTSNDLYDIVWKAVS
jgi:hypothetical protein